MTDPRARVLPPVKRRESGGPLNPISVRLPKELLLWVEKAAYRDGMSLSAFLRVAARDRADRVLGYNRDNRHTRRPPRDDEALAAINDDGRRRME